MFQNIWHLLLNVTIRWQCVYRRAHAFYLSTSLCWWSCSEMSENHQHIRNLLWSLSCTLCFIFTLDDKEWNWFRRYVVCLPFTLTHVYILPSDGKMHKCMPCAFKCMYSVSCVATFFAKKNSCWLVSDPCNNIKLYVTVNVWECVGM